LEKKSVDEPPKVEGIDEELGKELTERSIKKADPNAPFVYVAVPNMGMMTAGLFHRMFEMAEAGIYRLIFNTKSNARFHDHARNSIVENFMTSPEKPIGLLMIDSDCIPTKNVLTLVGHDKDIISGLAVCWIEGKLLPSVWRRAPCEQCRCRVIWQKEKKVNDPEQYREFKGILQRWNPFNNIWQDFVASDGTAGTCRCMGTGFDPWVFNAMDIDPNNPVMKADAVGAACTYISRRVLEKVPYPPFMFLYKPSRRIMLTEDMFFCWKASLAGFETWADVRVGVSHFKEVDLLAMFIMRNKAYMKGVADAKTHLEQSRIIQPQGIVGVR
jgi:hypothetical protein